VCVCVCVFEKVIIQGRKEVNTQRVHLACVGTLNVAALAHLLRGSGLRAYVGSKGLLHAT